MHGGLSSLLSVTWSDDITLRVQSGDGVLVSSQDGVGKVARLVVKQCYQRSVTVDTALHDGISESLHHTHNSNTLLLNGVGLRGHSWVLGFRG